MLILQDGRKASKQDSLLCGADFSSRRSPPRSWLRKGFIVNRDSGTDLREAEDPSENHCCLALECIDFAPRQFASLIPLGLSKQYKTCLPVLISSQLVARGRGLTHSQAGWRKGLGLQLVCREPQTQKLLVLGNWVSAGQHECSRQSRHQQEVWGLL